MQKRIIIRSSKEVRPNAFKLHFKCLIKHIRELGLFRYKDTKINIKVPTDILWQTLIEDGRNELVTLLQHVENREPGYGSIIVPNNGFSDSDTIHNMVLDWLHERDINVVNVAHEITCLERSLHPECNNAV